MLVYNHTAGTLTNESFGETGMAYWHGSANHLKIGKKDGFLIALMAETGPGGVPIKDDPAINDEHGSSVSLFTLPKLAAALTENNLAFVPICYVLRPR